MTSWNKKDIIYEDEQILVCRKHAGMAVQSARIGQMDMESAIKNYFDGGYVGIVQRLDQPVEGVIVFGKDTRSTANLNKQLQNGIMKKKYLAAFTGKPEKMEGRLEDFLLKNARTNTSSVVSLETAHGKRAVLDYRILGIKENVGLAEILLHTGRHHQIRVQMSYHGMPLWADWKYNPDITEEEQDDNIGLCAYELDFKHPNTGKKLHFHIEPEGEIFKNMSAYLKP